ncbi:hypothetical protein Y695_02312 [Hydrogenophaga sp. T4]|nr:hypothetical protein Y695_02312 [Hydrogenophaga sp. T4]
MQGAPDLWSMRAVVPWVEESLNVVGDVRRAERMSAFKRPATVVPLRPSQQHQWETLLTAPSWAEADLSAADVLALVVALRKLGWIDRGLTLAERLMHSSEFREQSPVWRAQLFVELSVLRYLAGDRLGALVPAQEAVTIYRQLSLVQPVIYDADLVSSLNNLISFLSEIGNHQDALALAQETVQRARRLVPTDRMSHAQLLASSLDSLAMCWVRVVTTKTRWYLQKRQWRSSAVWCEQSLWFMSAISREACTTWPTA